MASRSALLRASRGQRPPIPRSVRCTVEGDIGMLRYILKRLLLMIPTVLLTSLLIFWAMDLAGGDPVDSILPENATTEEKDAMRDYLGLNDPFLVRYGRYVLGMVQGDMGTSYKSGLDVFDTFMSRLSLTIKLGGSALIIACLIAIPLGIYTAIHQNSWKDTTGMVFALFGVILRYRSVPVYSVVELYDFIFHYFLNSLSASSLPKTYSLLQNWQLTLTLPSFSIMSFTSFSPSEVSMPFT